MAAFCTKYEEKVRVFIDIVDNMRSMAIDKEFSLPSIVVIGDQSSGKSSVLEMLSDVNLPRGNGISTRCPLELKLKKSKENKPWKARISCKEFDKTLDDPTLVTDEIIGAQNRLAEQGGISSELISVQVESNNAPDLTLIDLPGLVRVAVGNQPQDIGEKIKQLIRSYIKKKETIILVVIPCTVDLATTEALKLAQEVDPNGQRTLGVLTKPDLIDGGTESEVIKILENKVIPLKKGYILVKCRGHEQNTITTSTAIEEEKIFLKNNEVFRPLTDQGLASFDHLSNKLTTELVHQIITQLPIIKAVMREKIIHTTLQLENLRSNLSEEATSTLLYKKVHAYCEDVGDLINGEYKKDYESDLKVCDRARQLFAEWCNRLEIEKNNCNDAAIDMVKYHEKQSKGIELPGFTKYRIFETIAKQNIKTFLLPALQMMTEVADNIQSMFNRIGFQHFSMYPNLLNETKDLIHTVRKNQEQEARRMLKIHFNMEDMIYAPDAMYSLKLSISLDSQKEAHSKSSKSIPSVVSHLQTYYQIVIDRLVQMVPMVIRYQLLQEFLKQVQLKMSQTFLKGDSEIFMQEDRESAKKCEDLKNSLQRLMNARVLLMSEEVTRIKSQILD